MTHLHHTKSESNHHLDNVYYPSKKSNVNGYLDYLDYLGSMPPVLLSEVLRSKAALERDFGMNTHVPATVTLCILTHPVLYAPYGLSFWSGT